MTSLSRRARITERGLDVCGYLPLRFCRGRRGGVGLLSLGDGFFFFFKGVFWGVSRSVMDSAGPL